jgi:hypothetical protein
MLVEALNDLFAKYRIGDRSRCRSEPGTIYMMPPDDIRDPDLLATREKARWG